MRIRKKAHERHRKEREKKTINEGVWKEKGGGQGLCKKRECVYGGQLNKSHRR